MLTPRLTECKECADIQSLIAEIDCKVSNLSSALYNNIIFMLNKPVPAGAFLDLLTYRRILQYKYINPYYLSEYTVNMIASKVKILKYK